jgi:hypothetical protein
VQQAKDGGNIRYHTFRHMKNKQRSGVAPVVTVHPGSCAACAQLQAQVPTSHTQELYAAGNSCTYNILQQQNQLWTLSLPDASVQLS